MTVDVMVPHPTRGTDYLHSLPPVEYRRDVPDGRGWLIPLRAVAGMAGRRMTDTRRLIIAAGGGLVYAKHGEPLVRSDVLGEVLAADPWLVLPDVDARTQPGDTGPTD